MAEKKKREEREVAKTYFGMGDGGLSVRIADKYGPQIEFSTSSFGNLQNSMRVMVEPMVLLQLSKFFWDAAREKYSEPYVYPLSGRMEDDEAKALEEWVNLFLKSEAEESEGF